jgi:hypothetical protein
MGMRDIGWISDDCSVTEVSLGEELSVACSIPLFLAEYSKDRPITLVVGSTSTMKLGLETQRDLGKRGGKSAA